MTHFWNNFNQKIGIVVQIKVWEDTLIVFKNFIFIL